MLLYSTLFVSFVVLVAAATIREGSFFFYIYTTTHPHDPTNERKLREKGWSRYVLAQAQVTEVVMAVQVRNWKKICIWAYVFHW